MPTTGSTSTGYAHFIIPVIIYSSSTGIATGCARRAVHAGPSVWGSRWTVCGEEEKGLLEYLHKHLLQPCYATVYLLLHLHPPYNSDAAKTAEMAEQIAGRATSHCKQPCFVSDKRYSGATSFWRSLSCCYQSAQHWLFSGWIKKTTIPMNNGCHNCATPSTTTNRYANVPDRCTLPAADTNYRVVPSFKQSSLCQPSSADLFCSRRQDLECTACHIVSASSVDSFQHQLKNALFLPLLRTYLLKRLYKATE